MSDNGYTISIENVHHTIDKMHRILSTRNIKVKKSDLKELVSDLLGFDTSNVLDFQIKQHKLAHLALCPFDKNGQHRDIDDLVLLSSKNPLDIHDFFHKNKNFTTIIIFSNDLQVSGGFKYETDFTLFAKDQLTALKAVLNWDDITEFQFKYWKDEDGYDVEPEMLEKENSGYWECSFIGNQSEQYLGVDGSNYIDSITGDPDEQINNSEAPISQVSNFFLTTLLDSYEQDYDILDREDFESFLNDWIVEFYAETFSATNDKEFYTHIRKFLPYIPIEEIVAMEVGEASISRLEILQKIGGKFDAKDLHEQTFFTGNVVASEYLIAQGNELDNLLVLEHADSIFHKQARLFGNDESTKIFFNTAKKLGISLDTPNLEGDTPLHIAAMNRDEELYKHLLLLGARSDIENDKGDTPTKLMEIANTYGKEKQKKGSIFSPLFDDLFGSNWNLE